MKYIRIITIFLLVALSSACSSEKEFTGERVTPQKLPSGNEIIIKSMAKVYFSNDEPALVFKYETNHDISDIVALRKEADEIWIEFRKNVELAGLNNAVIQASKITKKYLIITTSKTHGFIYRKNKSGIWAINENS